MKKITENDVNENYNDIIHVVESESIGDVSLMLGFGARLLAINKNPIDYNCAFVYCVGWPSSSGDIPSLIQNYGKA